MPVTPQQLIEWRTGRRLSINAAAMMLDLNRSTVINLEQGHKPIRRVHALAIIALDRLFAEGMSSQRRISDPEIRFAFPDGSGTIATYPTVADLPIRKARKTTCGRKSPKSPIGDRHKAKKATPSRLQKRRRT